MSKVHYSLFLAPNLDDVLSVFRLLVRPGTGNWCEAAALFYETVRREDGSRVSFRDVAAVFGVNVRTVIDALRARGVRPNRPGKGGRSVALRQRRIRTQPVAVPA